MTRPTRDTPRPARRAPPSFPYDWERNAPDGFHRRWRAAEGGRALPSTTDLLRMAPFLRGDVRADSAAWMEQLRRDHAGVPEHAAAVARLAALLPGAAGLADYERLADAAHDAASESVRRDGTPTSRMWPQLLHDAGMRAQIYAAACGSRSGALGAAVAAVSHADGADLADEAWLGAMISALGWLAVAADPALLPARGRDGTEAAYARGLARRRGLALALRLAELTMLFDPRWDEPGFYECWRSGLRKKWQRDRLARFMAEEDSDA